MKAFLRGLASIFNIWPAPRRIHPLRHGSEWREVGDCLRQAMRTIDCQVKGCDGSMYLDRETWQKIVNSPAFTIEGAEAAFRHVGTQERAAGTCKQSLQVDQ